ncbi:MAG TPA: substrate-binding domain-containing protein [Roseiflexaceae bacterium]|nr:substrate-binding domain-containing protein [Roseiflexaceae bacterium]HMP41869.1 substrate-binding domain-containing protein [Roseiflexaceae bacterium]
MHRMSQQPITITDIAREAGVSPSTVSRVLNGTVPVAEAKRDAVLAVVKRLRYRPSAIAQGLVRGRTDAIGVLTQSVASPFYGEVLLGIERGLDGSGYHAIFASGNWRTDDEIAALDLLSGRRVDALIILSGVIDDAHLRQVAEDLPLVVIGRSLTGMEERCLRIDDLRAASDATRHLIELGHTRIAHIAGPALHQDALDRRAGYLRAHEAAGLTVDPRLIIEGDYTEQSGLLAVQALMSSATHFSAIFAANDQMAYGARLALYRNQLRVPEDVSLLGFDDLPGSRYTTPPLTTVRQPALELGRAAAHAALQILDDQPADLPILTADLVIRESTARRR